MNERLSPLSKITSGKNKEKHKVADDMSSELGFAPISGMWSQVFVKALPKINL